jgi:hypothetical protein
MELDLEAHGSVHRADYQFGHLANAQIANGEILIGLLGNIRVRTADRYRFGGAIRGLVRTRISG